ncbi:MAG: SpoIIE family protein phosphatase [Deltaproteobacteria bacterium]|nr:SpoIIE family protein phosphatase [Deltaproteobacteria bacterium]
MDGKTEISGDTYGRGPDGKKIRVLIADDDPVIRALVKGILQKAGYDVVVAENGLRAVELMTDQIGAVLLDLHMPKMDGLECLRAISSKYKGLPPIMLTASDDVSNAVEAMRYGAFDYITKPFNPKKVLALVKKSSQAYEQTRRLRKVEAELARAREHEIFVASEIQRTMLLGQPPDDLKGLGVANLTIPSQSVDGDFYDFFKSNDHSLDLLVADVMGKGIMAAFLGAAMKSRFLRVMNELGASSGRHDQPSPEQIITAVHAGMIKQMEDLETFVTLCYGRFDLKTGEFTFVDCGHVRTIYHNAHADKITLLQGVNMPLGFPEIDPFKQIVQPFNAGDLFVFYSDGLTEATNPKGEMYGEERLTDLIFQNVGLENENLLKTVRQSIESFTGSKTFDDDFTCVLVRIDPAPDGALITAMDKLEIESDLDELAGVRLFVRNFCEAVPDNRIGSERMDKLEIAITEVVTNIIRHAYNNQKGRKIVIDAGIYDEKLVLNVYDRGCGFDPEDVPPPEFDGSKYGGFGVFIIRESVDKITYSRNDEGRNCTCLTVGLTQK